MTETKKTTTKTTSAKAPQDHKEPEQTTAEAHDALLEQEELLAGIPELKPPHRLRLRDRNKIMAILFESGLMDADGNVTIDTGSDGFDFGAIKPMFEIAAQVDEFAESIALDREAYVDWAEENGGKYEAFFALLMRYAATLGESSSSAS